MNLDPDSMAAVKSAVPGVAGSLISMLFIKDTWPRRLALVAAGSASSYYGTPWAAKMVNLDLAFAGFLVGLLSMTVIAQILDALAKIDAAQLIGDWLRKVLGLPAKEI